MPWPAWTAVIVSLSVLAGCTSVDPGPWYCSSSLGIEVTAHPPERVLRIVGHGQACEGQTFDCGSGSSDCNPKDGAAHATFHPSDTGDCRIDVELTGGCVVSQTVKVSTGGNPACAVLDRDSVEFIIPADIVRDASSDGSCSR